MIGKKNQRNDLQKEWRVLEKKEKKLLVSNEQHKLKNAIYQKVPSGLSVTLEMAFAKAFRLVFLKGTKVIEKTFDKESVCLEFEAGNYVVEKAGSRKSIKKLEKTATKKNRVNHAAALVSGMGLGILGLGIPDIPILVSTLLKGIYEIALGYGFSYDTNEEKIYILRLIKTALSSGEAKLLGNQQLDQMECAKETLEEEIAITAKALSDALLVEKFVQGIPVVGIIGGIVNFTIYTKISEFSSVKYKKRYLQGILESK